MARAKYEVVKKLGRYYTNATYVGTSNGMQQKIPKVFMLSRNNSEIRQVSTH